jgi:hypothetical protein
VIFHLDGRASKFIGKLRELLGVQDDAAPHRDQLTGFHRCYGKHAVLSVPVTDFQFLGEIGMGAREH